MDTLASRLGLRYDFEPFTTEYAPESSPNGLPLFSAFCRCHSFESRVDIGHGAANAVDAAWQITAGHNFDVELSDIVIRVLA